MNSKVKIALGLIVALFAGYLLGSFFGVPPTSDRKAKGDVSQVGSSSKNLSSAVKEYQEKIMSSEEEFNKASASLSLISSRINEFNELVNVAIEASQGKQELEEPVQELKTVQGLSENAKIAGQNAVKAFESLSKGSRSPEAGSYETAAQNITIAYLMIDRQVNVGKHYVTAVDEYLKDKDENDEMDLAIARDLWANYCASSALLNNDSDETAFWEKQGAILQDDVINKNLSSNDLGHLETILDNISPVATVAMK
jgi:hypothetical protein